MSDEQQPPAETAVVDPWQQLAEAHAPTANEIASAAANATSVERTRCRYIVEAAIEQGRVRGLSPDAPVMRILAGISAAIG